MKGTSNLLFSIEHGERKNQIVLGVLWIAAGLLYYIDELFKL